MKETKSERENSAKNLDPREYREQSDYRCFVVKGVDDKRSRKVYLELAVPFNDGDQFVLGHVHKRTDIEPDGSFCLTDCSKWVNGKIQSKMELIERSAIVREIPLVYSPHYDNYKHDLTKADFKKAATERDAIEISDAVIEKLSIESDDITIEVGPLGEKQFLGVTPHGKKIVENALKEFRDHGKDIQHFIEQSNVSFHFANVSKLSRRDKSDEERRSAYEGGNLTVLERKVLDLLFQSSEGNGHDFGFIEDARSAVNNANQLSGVIASLIKKNFIHVYPKELGHTQFQFLDLDRAEVIVKNLKKHKRPYKDGFKSFGPGSGGGINWALFRFPIDPEVMDGFDVYYGGPGKQFAKEPSVRRVGKRVLITQEIGRDI